MRTFCTILRPECSQMGKLLHHSPDVVAEKSRILPLTRKYVTLIAFLLK